MYGPFEKLVFIDELKIYLFAMSNMRYKEFFKDPAAYFQGQIYYFFLCYFTWEKLKQ